MRADACCPEPSIGCVGIVHGGVVVARRSHAAVNREERAQMESPLSIVVALVGGGIELERSLYDSGLLRVEFSSLRAPAGEVRSSQAESAPDGGNVLVGTIDDPGNGLHVELMIGSAKASLVILVLKFSRGNAPYSNVRISLLKNSVIFHSKRTGDKGDVEFRDLPPGKYVIKMPGDLLRWPLEVRDRQPASDQ